MTAILAHARHGMVTSPHHLASEAGLNILRDGGNAIEAVIAIAACLSVTYPHFCGLGGDGFVIISTPEGQVQTISGIGQAAENIDFYQGSIPQRGPKAMLTSAAHVDALGKAYELSTSRFLGRKTWGDLLKPAIQLAHDGFAVTCSQQFWLDFRRPDLPLMPAVDSHFQHTGQGQILRQPELARSLEQLARNGHRDFYEGELSARIATGLQAAGSPLTAADLARTKAYIEQPLSLPYRGGTLYAHQPPTQASPRLKSWAFWRSSIFPKFRKAAPTITTFWLKR